MDRGEVIAPAAVIVTTPARPILDIAMARVETKAVEAPVPDLGAALTEELMDITIGSIPVLAIFAAGGGRGQVEHVDRLLHSARCDQSGKRESVQSRPFSSFEEVT